MEYLMHPKNLFAQRRCVGLARIISIALIAFLFGTLTLASNAQSRSRKVAGAASARTKSLNASLKKSSKRAGDKSFSDNIPGVTTIGSVGIPRVTAEIMQAQMFAPRSSRPLMIPEREGPEIDHKKPNPDAPAVASWPVRKSMGKTGDAAGSLLAPSSPQVIGMNFDTVTGPAETGAFPPDTMGAVGPSQLVVFVNGRLRSFSKSAGTADGVLNVDPDVFFSSVTTPVSGPVVLNFTSDPQVRYDRLSGRWFLSIIDVPCTNATCTTTAANRWMVAVSDAASNGVISPSTVWTFYFNQTDAINFCDYPSLGIDNLALYFGCNMFSPAGAFVNTNALVVRKGSVTSGGPIVVTKFAGLIDGASEGPFAPRGVDNYDPASSEGYFIGVSNIAFSRLDIRRVSNPGGTPTISGNILLAVPTTTFPNTMEHTGNLGGANGNLDTLDDRLYAAHIRNGRLWTAHNFRVSAAGVANTGIQSRNGLRWYELNGVRSTDNGGTPILVQSGTIFDTAPTRAAARQYSIPSVTVSGQGHAAIGFSTAGAAFRINAGTAGRLAGDTLGTMQAVNVYTTSTTAYNPPSDPGGAGGRRWGDYSFTSLDPLDDMTMWTVQEYCVATNSYGARVAQLKAPPPATPSSTDRSGGLLAGQASINMVVTGTSTAGSGFFDPGPDLAAPARPFNHISASMSGGVTVNSVTYNSPTQVTLNISTVGATAGPKSITITNPDGQSATGNNLVTILAPTAAGATIAGRVSDSRGFGLRNVAIRIVSQDGTRDVTAITNSFGYYRVDGLPSGQAYLITPVSSRYTFSPQNRLLTLNEDVLELGFTAAP